MILLVRGLRWTTSSAVLPCEAYRQVRCAQSFFARYPHKIRQKRMRSLCIPVPPEHLVDCMMTILVPGALRGTGC